MNSSNGNISDSSAQDLFLLAQTELLRERQSMYLIDYVSFYYCCCPMSSRIITLYGDLHELWGDCLKMWFLERCLIDQRGKLATKKCYLRVTVVDGRLPLDIPLNFHWTEGRGTCNWWTLLKINYNVSGGFICNLNGHSSGVIDLFIYPIEWMPWTDGRNL